MHNFISIIVVCFNEEKYIEKSLGALSNQNYPKDKFEIILIDNGSTDSSVEIAKKFTDKIFIKPELKLGAMRNFGAKQSKGEILAFLDGDSVPESNCLSVINEINIEFPNTVNGAQLIIPKDAPWVPKAWFCTNSSGRLEVNELCANNFCIEKKNFEDIKGFDEKLTTGEDAELFARLRTKYLVMNDSRMVAIHHGIPKTLKTFFFREIWHGLGALGSFKVDKFDKPLIATIVFSLGIILSIFGLLICSSYFKLGFLVWNGILFMTLLFRKDFIRDLLHAAQLYILYFAYYTARSISLIKLILKRKHSYYNKT